MPEKKKTRNDQEWLALIQECRASGLPVKQWCQMHSIPIKTFYNKISGLRKKGCGIPKSQAAPSGRIHEVVPLELAAHTVVSPECPAGNASWVPAAHTAVTVRMHGCSIEISNDASEDTIRNTLLALERLC